MVLDPVAGTTYLAFVRATSQAVIGLTASGQQVWKTAYQGSPATITVDPRNHRVTIAGIGYTSDLLVTQYDTVR